VFDPAGNEVRRNDAMRQMLAGTPAAGAGPYNLLEDPAARASGDVDRFRRALAGEVVVDRAGAPAPGGGEAAACPGAADRVFYPVPDGLGGVQAVVVFCVDVTEQRQLEQQFLEAQKLESLGVLAGGLAHDLNNLMTPVVGHAELALRAVPDEAREAVADDLRQVTRSAEQAANLCRQLLAYAGRGRFVVGPVGGPTWSARGRRCCVTRPARGRSCGSTWPTGSPGCGRTPGNCGRCY
jgi:signal transduction histidine kinase